MKITLEDEGQIRASVEDPQAITATEVVELFYRAMLGVGFERACVAAAFEDVADEHGILTDVWGNDWYE